jgi:hypothetical protein
VKIGSIETYCIDTDIGRGLEHSNFAKERKGVVVHFRFDMKSGSTPLISGFRKLKSCAIPASNPLSF